MKVNQVLYRRSRYNRSAKALILKVLRGYTADLMQRLSGITDPAMMQREAEKPVSKEPMQAALIQIYKAVGSDFAKEQIKDIKRQTGKKAERRQNIETDFWQMYFESYAKTKTGQKVTWITTYTEEVFKSKVAQVIEEAGRDGYSVWKTMNNLQKELSFSDQYRAERIARTEIIAASNAGSFEGAKQAGIPLKKKWVPVVDDRTRPQHADMAGMEPIDLNEAFNVGGEEMMMPGEGSAENVINCRCYVDYIPETDEEQNERWQRI